MMSHTTHREFDTATLSFSNLNLSLVSVAEDKEVKEKLMKKYSSKKNKDTDAAVLKIRMKGGKEKVRLRSSDFLEKGFIHSKRLIRVPCLRLT